jgi:hypothetical protein
VRKLGGQTENIEHIGGEANVDRVPIPPKRRGCEYFDRLPEGQEIRARVAGLPLTRWRRFD